MQVENGDISSQHNNEPIGFLFLHVNKELYLEITIVQYEYLLVTAL